MKDLRRPLLVTVLWTDAQDERGECEWDDVYEHAKLCANRLTSGFLAGVEAEGDATSPEGPRIILAHDWDEDTRTVGNYTTLPLGWVQRIKTSRGKVIYERR